MKKFLGSLAALSLAAATMLFSAPVNAAPFAPPSGSAATPHIIGGEKAPSTPWAVQLLFVQNGQTYGCTGEQLTASWVLTAQHCIDGISSMNVYHSNSTSNRGSASPVDAVYAAPAGDIALVHLQSAYSLGSYPTLNLTASAASTGTGTIYGYGARANGASASGLYRATVLLTGSTRDAYNGRAQHLTGSTGAANHGDSGGPLIVNGRIIAVCSTGDESDPGANSRAGSNYALLSQSASWIRSTAGV